MKITLILPNATSRQGTLSDFNYASRLLTPKTKTGQPNTMALMPLALPTLAALTPSDIDVKIVDENVENINFEEPVDIVGISFVSFMAKRTYRIADLFRKRGVHVVLGGIHVTISPEEASAHADTIVVGEAEETWPEFIEDFRKGRPKGIYSCQKRPDLKQSVVPRWDLIKNKYYLFPSIQTTRGCSRNCDFCMIRSVLGKPRFKPIENVLSELETLIKYHRAPGRLTVFLADDNVVSSVKYAKELFKALIPYKIRWFSQADLGIAKDDELLSLAQKSGCDSLLMGFESISQTSLDSVNKGQVNKVESFKDSIKKIHERGINIYPFIMYGFDDNGVESFKETIEFIQDNDLEYPLFNILSPVPGTRLYDRLNEEGRILPNKNWVELNGYDVGFMPKKMSAEDLLAGFRRSIIQAHSHDALVERLENSYLNGASKRKDREYILKAFVSMILVKELLTQDWAMRRFILRILKEMWSKRDMKLNSLMLFLDRFEFAHRFQKAHPQ